MKQGEKLEKIGQKFFNITVEKYSVSTSKKIGNEKLYELASEIKVGEPLKIIVRDKTGSISEEEKEISKKITSIETTVKKNVFILETENFFLFLVEILP